MTSRGLPLLGLLVAVLAATALSCDSADDSGPVPSPAPEGFAAFREFSSRIAGALDARDAGFFLSLSPVQDGICTGRENVTPCAGMPAGSAYRGRLVKLGTIDPLVFPEEHYAEQLRSYLNGELRSFSDQFGPGEVTLVALATPPRSANPFRQALGRRNAYYAITSGIVNRGSENKREVHVLVFSPASDGWDFVGEVLPSADGDPTEVYAAWLNGSCVGCYDYFEPTPATPS